MPERWPIPAAEALDLFHSTRAVDSANRHGFYNANAVTTWRGSRVVVRSPLHAADRMDLMIWPEEWVLQELAHRTPLVPKVLFASTSPRFQIHSFIAGPIVDDLTPRGTAVSADVVNGIIGLLTVLATTPRADLPDAPSDWPQDGNSTGILRLLVSVTMQVYARAGKYRPLLDTLGIPPEPLRPIERQMRSLTRRPHVLVHADIHRKNMIKTDRGPVVLDWELAIPGDPVYEIAVHIHKMGYRPDEEQAVLTRWREALPNELTRGWETDISVYLAHERIKSAIVDTVRYAKVLRNGVPPSTRDALLTKLQLKLEAAHTAWGTEPPQAECVRDLMVEVAGSD